MFSSDFVVDCDNQHNNDDNKPPLLYSRTEDKFKKYREPNEREKGLLDGTNPVNSLLSDFNSGLEI